MRRSKRARRRLPFLVALMATILALGILTAVQRTASADGLASVGSCAVNAKSSAAVDCTITLNYGINSGGSWRATITDTSAVITSCDASAAQATCTAGSNTAEFDCPSGCAQNSTYKITVTASAATAAQEWFTVLSGAGGLMGGSSTLGTSANVVSGYSYPTYALTSAGTTTAYAAPSYSLLPGGACVNGSVPGPNGCTSGFGGYGYGLGGYGLGYGGYRYGGYSGLGYGWPYGGYSGFGGSCLYSFTFCGSTNFGCFGGFTTLSFGCNGCGFGGVTCNTTCAMSTSCTLTVTTTGRTCNIFGVVVNC